MYTEKQREYHRQWYCQNRERVLRLGKEWKLKNPDKVRKHARDYYKRNKKRIRKYYKTYYWDNKKPLYEAIKEWRKNNPEIIYAYSAVQNALKHGRLKKGKCEIGKNCKGRIEAHHDDYFKPLDVRWLCRRHHKKLHRK